MNVNHIALAYLVVVFPVARWAWKQIGKDGTAAISSRQSHYHTGVTMKNFTKLNAALEPVDQAATDHVAVLDKNTGLTWLVANVGDKRLTHEDAIAACKALVIGDKTDWRLPTVQELLTLVNYERVNPAIDTDAFPGCKPNFYWSSSPYAGSSDCAWPVYFDSGGSYFDSRNRDGFVRAVRGPVAASQ